MKMADAGIFDPRSALQPGAAGRLWRIAPIVGAVCGILACSREAPRPAARQVQTQSAQAAAVAIAPKAPRHAGATGAEYGSYATAGDGIPETLREGCSEVNRLVRSLVDAAPASTKIGEVTGPRPILFHYLYAKAQAPGCDLVVRGSDAALSSNLFTALEKTLDTSDWQSLAPAYSADGPDGSDIAYSRTGLQCVLEGRWDGGDDSDPTVVPSPDFDIFITCAPLRADDRPDDRGHA